MADRLALYNEALRHLGERKLASLTEDQESRFLLDTEYDSALKLCLRRGYWNFAMRAVKLDFDITPVFGYQFGFTKPNDWLKTDVISASETFNPPEIDFQDQYGFWLANTKTMYFRFVSTTTGMVEANFPPDYAEYVSGFLALTIMPRITQASEDSIIKFERRVERMLKVAQANDAMDQGPRRLPLGSWVTSRFPRTGGRMFPGLG